MTTKNAKIDEQFIQNVCNALDSEGPVKRMFSPWGRLHIDRRLPFMCIYRKPDDVEDKKTAHLLLGQASYIIVREQDANHPCLRLLLEQIANKLQKLFGSFLFFEMWTSRSTISDIESHAKLQFDIKTSERNPPLDILEEMENALLDIDLGEIDIQLSLDYAGQPHAENMSVLLPKIQSSTSHQYWLGLAVSPVFRQQGRVLPYQLRLLQAGLTKALRRTFFAFIRQYTSHAPAHFHELGHRSITPQVLEIDKKIASVKDQFDILFHVTPVNSDEAWQDFSDNSYRKIPTFKYRPRPIDPDLLKRQLYAIEIEQLEDPTLVHIFQTQRDEISRLLSMIDDRGTANFLYGSMQVYGGVDSSLLLAARLILQNLDVSTESEQSPRVSADEFANRARALIKRYQQQHAEFCYEVELRTDIPGVLVSNGKLMIGHAAVFSQNTVDATLAHEIGTHMVTHFNGSAQPFQQFHSGMQDYEPLQEGLAVLSEYLVGQLHASRLRTIAARVSAVHACIQGADFIEVFTMLHLEYDFSPENAFRISMRVFRGGGFTKDAIYLKGLLQATEYLKNGGDIGILFIGKIALKHLSLVDELRWRKMLKESLVVPHFLLDKMYPKRINNLREINTFTDLVNGDR
ncbi:tyrosine/phenylalanine carboxypeptidase domain-containing protein [Aliiglaciecola sp. LCG003]|uniref:flavohemoglobin expression-modulating QEGLA motif protein n=1 Tax=Aliiglaciecola sp. LCG003 TaxID=3053655 RepID=UPI00257332EC|nr:tyrosine/phenylalanine carboxypeptidase domain-containing protein [Aliiglaciecola sp. LCG003]WJG09180.1 DUF1704 domain-containing protein [Aliiglaciecola sp. LCG003]